MSSLTNFGVTVVAAHYLDASSFGYFALFMTMYLVLLAASRAVGSDPLMVRFSARIVQEQRSASSQAAGVGLCIGLTAGVALLLAGIDAPPAVRAIMLAFGISMPGLLIQDHYRYVQFVAAQPRAAAANDCSWVIVQFSITGCLLAAQNHSAFYLILAWGAGGWAGAVIGLYQTHILPNVKSAYAWVRNHRDLGLPFLGEFLGLTGMLQVSMFGIAAITSVVVVGEIRSATTLLGPLTIVLLGANVVVLPEAIRLRERFPEAHLRLLVYLGIGCPILTMGWTIGMLVLPRSLGVKILGSNWIGGHHVLLAVGVMTAGVSCAMIAILGLRSFEAARKSFLARLVSVPAVAAGAMIGAWLGGADGATWGLATAYWIDAGVAWAAFHRVWRSPPRFSLGTMNEEITSE